MAKIKKMKKMPKITGTISGVFRAENIYKTAVVVNAHSDAIDFLYEIIQRQNEEIEEMRRWMKEAEKKDGKSE